MRRFWVGLVIAVMAGSGCATMADEPCRADRCSDEPVAETRAVADDPKRVDVHPKPPRKIGPFPADKVSPSGIDYGNGDTRAPTDRPAVPDGKHVPVHD